MILYIDLPEDVFNSIQRTTYEVSSTQNVVNMFLQDHINDATADALESAIFKKYQEQLVNLNIRFDNEKAELTERFVPDNIKNTNYNWNVNFQTKQLEITYGENCVSGCNCR